VRLSHDPDQPDMSDAAPADDDGDISSGRTDDSFGGSTGCISSLS